MTGDERPDAGDERPPDEPRVPDEAQRDEPRQPPLAAMGIVAGTTIGAVAGLIVGHFAIGAGVGCAGGLVIGAAAQSMRAGR